MKWGIHGRNYWALWLGNQLQKGDFLLNAWHVEALFLELTVSDTYLYWPLTIFHKKDSSFFKHLDDKKYFKCATNAVCFTWNHFILFYPKNSNILEDKSNYVNDNNNQSSLKIEIKLRKYKYLFRTISFYFVYIDNFQSCNTVHKLIGRRS